MPTFAEFNKISFKQSLKDPSARGLVFSNLAVIIIALLEQWNLGTMMFVYWWQNVIIGFFNVLRILGCKNFTVKNVAAISPEMVWIGKSCVAGFFIIHYGFFHFGYLSFLKMFFGHSTDMKMVFLSVLIFFINHLFSFIYNYKNDCSNQTIRQLMFSPYPRIIPMHITIIAGMFILLLLQNAFAEKLVLVFFLTFKTVIDVKMHVFEHQHQ